MKRAQHKQKIVYIEGYDHYDKRRTIKFQLLLNEAEYNFLEDLFTVLQVHNKSAFIRNQVFHAYQSLTDQQRQQMAEVAHWRHENDNNSSPKVGEVARSDGGV